MSVVLSVEEIGPCRKQLKIEIPAPAVEAETASASPASSAARRRCPGFRKGKVPQSLVRAALRRRDRARGGRAPGAALLAPGRGREVDRSARCRRRSRWPRSRPGSR